MRYIRRIALAVLAIGVIPISFAIAAFEACAATFRRMSVLDKVNAWLFEPVLAFASKVRDRIADLFSPSSASIMSARTHAPLTGRTPETESNRQHSNLRSTDHQPGLGLGFFQHRMGLCM